MKKIIIIAAIFFFIFLIFLALILNKKRINKPINNSTSQGSYEISPFPYTPTPGNEYEPGGNASAYKTSWVVVRDTDKIELYSNLTDKLSSAEAMSKHSCQYLTSGSFYTEDGKHIGLFITGNETKNDAVESATFNGYFSVKNNNALIGSTVPQEASLAIQAGPLLMKNGTAIDLNMERDENARRNIVAVTKEGNVVFMTAFDKSNTLLGPKLEELGGILTGLQKNTTLHLKEALNLDGGSHSAFITNIIKLTEISTVGSYFCIKP